MPRRPLLPAFERLVVSNLSAHAAQQIAMAAAPIIAVTTLHADVGQVAWIQLAQMLPFLLFSIPAGVLADRMAPKALLLGGEAVRAITLIVVLAIMVSGVLNVPVLVVLSFLGSIGAVAYGVAVPSLTLGLADHAALPEANAKLELARSMAFIGGPALAGALIAWSGAPVALASAAALSTAAILLAYSLPKLPSARKERRQFITELLEGARFVLHDRLLRPGFYLAILYNAAFFILMTVLVPYASHQLGMSAAAIGLTLSAYGAGMVVAGLAAPALSRRVSIGGLLQLGVLGGLAAALLMAATIFVPTAWLVAGCFFLFGAAGVMWAVGFTTLRQLKTPADLMGRVTSITALATYGARPLGAAIAGVVGSVFSIETCLYVVLAAFAVEAVGFYLSALPGAEVEEVQGRSAENFE